MDMIVLDTFDAMSVNKVADKGIVFSCKYLLQLLPSMIAACVHKKFHYKTTELIILCCRVGF